MRITTRTTTRITPNCQFIKSPLGNEKKAPRENSLDRRTQPLGEETPEPIDLFRLREAPLGDNVEDQIGLVYHEQRGSFLPASQMIPRQPVGAVGVARLDTAVGADGLEWELEIALLTVDPTDAPGNIEEADKQLHAGDQQDEHQRWQSGAAVLHGNVCGEQRANPQQDPEHDPQHALPTERPRAGTPAPPGAPGLRRRPSPDTGRSPRRTSTARPPGSLRRRRTRWRSSQSARRPERSSHRPCASRRRSSTNSP